MGARSRRKPSRGSSRNAEGTLEQVRVNTFETAPDEDFGVVRDPCRIAPLGALILMGADEGDGPQAALPRV